MCQMIIMIMLISSITSDFFMIISNFEFKLAENKYCILFWGYRVLSQNNVTLWMTFYRHNCLLNNLFIMNIWCWWLPVNNRARRMAWEFTLVWCHSVFPSTMWWYGGKKIIGVFTYNQWITVFTCSIYCEFNLSFVQPGRQQKQEISEKTMYFNTVSNQLMIEYSM